MKDKLLQFKLQKVWTLVDLPNGKRAIGTKWVYKNKKDERDIVIKNKARLVAQGYTQEEEIDYDKVFSLVARIEAIRLFLAYASFKDFVVYQMGCPRLQVKQKEDGIFISQDKYVTEILKKFGFTDVKIACTPMETQKPLLKDEDGKEVDVHLYRLMIGSLMYLTASRPDIMFAACACVRYQVNPKVSHLHAVKRIFIYLKGQPKLRLWYPKDSPFDLVAYTDSDYAGASLDRKSTTGGCQFLRCRLISWQCKKQIVVVNSTTKAEYVAASSCCGQVLWIQNYGYSSVAEGDLRKFSDIGAWYAIEDYAQYDIKCSNPTSVIFDETIANPNVQIVRADMVRVQGLESEEVSPLGEELSLFDRPNEVERGRFDVFFRNQLLVFQQHQDESLYDSWTRFKDIIRKVPNHGLSIWTLIEIFLKHLDSLSRHIINLTAEGDLRKFSDIGAWDDMVRVQVPRCMAWLDYDEHVDSLSTMDNEVGVTSPKSTTQTLPLFEEYTPPVTYPEEKK
ncbi:uncharacterized mitochondrial protein-like protein [Tanacetum coccineum]|uniref:Uncharacterized mitochondrial protein-like protein n=1 Tax=Tanacetum coccineum TaxID=301880 RepID=A0ABQ5II45_9ASTR